MRVHVDIFILYHFRLAYRNNRQIDIPKKKSYFFAAHHVGKHVLNSENYDFLVVGAGIIGLAISKELTERFPSAKIGLIEKEKSIGMHASGRNSGILHSGIYYPQDSLKAAVCAKGAKQMVLFAKEHGIPCHKIGKVIIATCVSDIPTIDFLLKNAANNKLNAERLDENQIKEIEPHANAYHGGIFTPDTASIDSKKVLAKLSEIVTSRGVKLHLDQEIKAIDKSRKLARSSKQTFSYGYLFNASGSGTDKIAKMFGLAQDYRLLPFKGIYYKLCKEKNYLMNGNIYPVPDLQLPFLGVHFTKDIHGEIYVQPTAIPAFGRENYGLIQGISPEAFRIIKDISLMYIANQQNFRTLIHSEIKKYIKKHFINGAKKLITSIRMEDLLPSNKVGIRPQLINLKNRKIEMDYIIEQDSHSMHILNAISPAFTSAFSFAELLINRLELDYKDAINVGTPFKRIEIASRKR